MKKIYLMSLFCLIANLLLAQSITVTGTVKDAGTETPLIGVNVLEKGGAGGTVTDTDGTYTIRLSDSDAVLTFTYVGYEENAIAVNGRKSIDVMLSESSSLLNEVVVTALGLERETKDLGYAVQSLDAREVSEVKSPNFVDNLAGRLAGVSVSQGATGVGSTSKITIRGEASFTNNNPLFVVDGTPINNNSVVPFTSDAAAGFQEIDFGNGAMEVNPDDIASVSVLKGPSAAALYGTRASNGVVIITTKDGSRQKGFGISFNSTLLTESAFQLPEFQNDYGQGNSGEFEFVDGLGGGTNDNITYSWGPRTDQGTNIAQFDSPVTLADGTVVRGGDVAVHGGLPITPTPFVSHPNNLKDFYETGFTAINNLSISSGFERGNFRLSLTDLRNNSIIPGVNLDRKTVAAKMTFRPVDKLRINTSVNYINSQSDNRPSGGYGSENINYSLVAWGPRSMDTEVLRDYWQPGLEGLQQYSFNYTFFDNPYFILLENRNAFNRDRVFGNVTATYDFNSKFSATLRTGMDYSDELRQLRRAYSTNRFRNGAYAEHDVFYRENNTDFLLNYREDLGDITLDFSVGGNRLDQVASTAQTQASSLAQPGIYKLSNAASPLERFEFATEKRINSVYGFAKLGFRDYLFLDITGRNDWSSALATPENADNASFFYPSVSASFILSKVVPLPEAISFAKFRASWAQVGNDTAPYQTAGAFIAQTPFNSAPTFSAQSVIAAQGLLPEQTTSLELGADLRFFDDRVRLDATYYNTLTENQIISLPISVTSGYEQRVINGGTVRTTGIEAIVGLTPIYNSDFRWDSYLNFSTNEAIVESLPDEAGRLTLAYSRVYDNTNQTVWFQVEEGGRIGDMYGTGYARNDAGDFLIDADGRYIVDNELQLLGNYNPDFTLGWSNNLRYKNWNMSFLFDWRQGGVLVSRTQALAGVGGQLAETGNRDNDIVAEGVVNVGTEEAPRFEPNTTAVSPEQFYRQFYDRNHEENNTYDASYIKLRSFAVGYTFKSDDDSGFFRKGRNLNLSLIGRNLFAFSEIPHFDPEQLAVQGNNFVSGVEDMSYATSRSIGVKIGFDF